jgi:pyrroloquinoline quinone (PQQ) biosynthesis protein C
VSMPDDELKAARSRARAARTAIERAGGLVTEERLAEALGVSRQAIASRRAHGTLPDPVRAETERIRLYTMADVEVLREVRERRDTDPPEAE